MAASLCRHIFTATCAVCPAIPLPALSDDENAGNCRVSRGVIDADSGFTESDTGQDYKITCTGQLSEKLTNDTIKTLLDSRQGFVKGTSRVVLDLSGVTGGPRSVSMKSDAALNIVTGTITTDADT